MKPVRPADVMVVLATAIAQRRGTLGSASADGVAHALQALGFEATAQQAAAYLRRVARLDCPPLVMRPDCFLPWTTYLVTGFGQTWVHNLLGLRLEGEFPLPSEIEGER